MKKKKMFQRAIPTFGVLPHPSLSVEEAIDAMANLKARILGGIDSRNSLQADKAAAIDYLVKEISDLEDEKGRLEALVKGTP